MGLEDVDRTVDLIAKVRKGRTVVMVEHNMSVVGRLADTVTVLQAGKVLVEGPYEQVRADERVITAYLGATDAAH
jgi:branched-chain amino acid transport system ATP-binding protein